MNIEDTIIDFRKRTSKPINPVEGTFYWVENPVGTHQLYFSPDDESDHLILLNNDYPEGLDELIDRLSVLEGKLGSNKTIKSVTKDGNNYVFKLSDDSEIKIETGSFSLDDLTPEQLVSLKGKDGQDGKDGKDGTPGADGKDGENGKSAYEIAVANGFAGTEPEWLESLKGQDGVIGQDGTPGVDGKDGKSAYELYLETVSESEIPMTLEEWLESLKGQNGTGGDIGDSDIDDIADEVQSRIKLVWKKI